VGLDKDISHGRYMCRSVRKGKELAHPADFEKELEEILSGKTKVKTEDDYSERARLCFHVPKIGK
jgi:hypothetical protein